MQPLLTEVALRLTMFFGDGPWLARQRRRRSTIAWQDYLRDGTGLARPCGVARPFEEAKAVLATVGTTAYGCSTPQRV